MTGRADLRLSDSERRQLRVLKAVYDNPGMTGTWRKDECDRLVSLGLAQRHEAYPGIFLVSITPKGVEAANALDVTRCARDSDWCDGVICKDNGIDCENADA